METFQALLARRLSDTLSAASLPQAGEVSAATDARFGDYQTNAALILAKQRGENPRVLAQRILDLWGSCDLCEPPQIAGAGFINFTLRREALEAKTTELLSDERLGVARTDSPKKIVIDFGSPNVAKPMHIGHIRSTVLGDALARIASFLGHDVIRDNHIGDWGTQFGMVIYGWKNLLDRAALAADPIAELVRIYKKTNELGTADPAIRERCKEELVKLQAHDPENFAIWQECVNLSMGEFERTYALLDIRYDIQRGESFYNDRLPGVVARLREAGIAEESEGAIVVFFPEIPGVSRQTLPHPQKRWRLQLRHHRSRHGRLSRARPKGGRHLVRRGRPADSAFQTNLRHRAARRLRRPISATSRSAASSAKTANS